VRPLPPITARNTKRSREFHESLKVKKLITWVLLAKPDIINPIDKMAPTRKEDKILPALRSFRRTRSKTTIATTINTFAVILGSIFKATQLILLSVRVAFFRFTEETKKPTARKVIVAIKDFHANLGTPQKACPVSPPPATLVPTPTKNPDNKKPYTLSPEKNADSDSKGTTFVFLTSPNPNIFQNNVEQNTNPAKRLKPEVSSGTSGTKKLW